MTDAAIDYSDWLRRLARDARKGVPVRAGAGNLTKAAERIAELETALEAAEDKLHSIGIWANAYPEDIFTPPSEADLVEACSMIGSKLCTQLHADWGRRILAGVREILDDETADA